MSKMLDENSLLAIKAFINDVDSDIRSDLESEINLKQNKLTAGTNISISGDVISCTNQGDTYKVASGVSNYSLAYNTPYMIVIKNGGKVTINGTDYYGTFFISHRSTYFMTTSGTGLTTDEHYTYEMYILGQKVTWTVYTGNHGVHFKTVNTTLYITCSTTMDIYQIS